MIAKALWPNENMLIRKAPKAAVRANCSPSGRLSNGSPFAK